MVIFSPESFDDYITTQKYFTPKKLLLERKLIKK